MSEFDYLGLDGHALRTFVTVLELAAKRDFDNFSAPLQTLTEAIEIWAPGSLQTKTIGVA